MTPKSVLIVAGLVGFTALAGFGFGQGSATPPPKVITETVTVKVPQSAETVTKTTNELPQACRDLIGELRNNIEIQKEVADLPTVTTVSRYERVAALVAREVDSSRNIDQLSKSCR